MTAEQALRAQIEHTFDYHANNPDFVRLVMNENILRGAHIGEIPGIRERNRKVVEQLRNILARGVASGHFREGIDPLELHMTISALCFYNVSNRYTVSYGFERDVTAPKILARRRGNVVDIVESWCRA